MQGRAAAGAEPASGVRCPHCAALNPAGALWCGQCLARFAEPEADAADDRADHRTPSTAPEQAPPGAFRATEHGITWTCRICERPNALERQSCSVCGSPLAATLRAPETAGPERDPGTTAMMSLFWPGAGHAYLGMWGRAVARGITSAWVVALALLSALQQGFDSAPAITFGVASFALWAVCSHDAYREATRDSGAVILKDRRFVYLVLGLLVLSMATVLVTAMSASR